MSRDDRDFTNEVTKRPGLTPPRTHFIEIVENA